MKKINSGFSYLEVLLSAAIFSIALVAVLPTLSQAARNLMMAEEVYTAHLRANHMMLMVREAAHSPAQAEVAARAFAADRGGFYFTLWLVRGTEIIHTVHTAPHPPAAEVFDFTALPGRTMVVIALRNANGFIIAHAIGAA